MINGINNNNAMLYANIKTGGWLKVLTIFIR